MHRRLNWRQKSTLACVQPQAAVPPAPAPAVISADDINWLAYLILQQHITLPETLYVGPLTHAACRRLTEAPVQACRAVLRNRASAPLCDLELFGKPLRLHTACPEGAIYTLDGRTWRRLGQEDKQ